MFNFMFFIVETKLFENSICTMEILSEILHGIGNLRIYYFDFRVEIEKFFQMIPKLIKPNE